MSKPTHKTAKKENPGSGGRGAMRRAHAVTQFDVSDARDKRIAELEAALRSVSQQCENVIFNCEQRPADNERHLSSWRSVRDYAAAAIGS